MQCDASNFAYGGQLYQLDEEGKVGVIAFTSKTFKGAERNYYTTEKELLSIIRCLEKFRIYILGQPLTIKMCIRDRHKEEIKRQTAEQLTQIRSEIREYQQAWEGKINELQKKQDDIVRDLREEANKKYEEIQETRENGRQEWMAVIHTTQTTIKKINNKFDAHVKDANKKQEEFKAEIHDTIRQKQQEQDGTNNNIIQKLEEVDSRQRSTCLLYTSRCV